MFKNLMKEAKILTTAFKSLVGTDRPVGRGFRTFDRTDDYITIPAVEAVGAFELEMDIATTLDTVTFVALSGNNNQRISIGSGFADIRFNSTIITGTTYIADGELHTIGIKYDGLNLFLYVDNVLDGFIASPQSTDNVMTHLGVLNNVTQHFEGVIANVNFKSGWVTSDGAINPFYALDDSDQIARNSNSGFGEELSEVTASTVNAPWVFNSGSSYSIDGSQIASTNIYYGGLLTAGKTYYISITTTNSTAGSVRPETSEIDLAYSVGNTTTTWVFTPTSNTNFNIQADADFDGDISYTLRKAPGYGSYQNFETDLSDIEFMTEEEGTGHWLSPNRMADSGFTSSAIWAEGVGWSVANGLGISDGSQIADSFMAATTPFTIGMYLARIIVVESNGSPLSLRMGGGTAYSDDFTELGLFSAVLPYTTGGSANVVADAAFVGKVGNFTVQRILQVPQPAITPVYELPVTSRLFTTLDGTDDGYTIPTASAAGDFEFEFQFSTLTDGQYLRLIDGPNGGTNGISIWIDTGVLVVRVSVSSTSTYLSTAFDITNDGDLHTANLRGYGDTLYLQIDEGESYSMTVAGTNIAIDTIGKQWSSAANFFPGIIANVNFKSGFVSSDGSINPFYPLDDADGIVRNTNSVVGPQLLANTRFLNSDGWVLGASASMSGGVLRLASDIAVANQHGLDITNGEIHLVTYTITFSDTDALLYLSSGGYGGTSQSIDKSVGTHSVLLTVVNDTLPFRIILATGYSYGSIDITKIVVQKVQGYGEANNFETDLSDKTPYKLVDDAWLSAEDVTDATEGFTYKTDWEITEAVVIHSNDVTWNDTGVFGPQLFNADRIGVFSEDFIALQDAAELGITPAGNFFEGISVRRKIAKGIATYDGESDYRNSRSFIKFDETDDYISLPSVTAVGDFELEMLVSIPTTSNSWDNLLSGPSNRFSVKTDGSMMFGTTGNVIDTGVLSVFTKDGLFNVVNLSKKDNRATLKINGVAVIASEDNFNNATTVFDRVGWDSQVGGDDRLKGTIANVNFKSGWITSDGLENPFYALDEASGNVALNSNAIVGPNLIRNGNMQLGTSVWVPLRSAKVTVIGDAIYTESTIEGQQGEISQAIATEVGVTYYLSVETFNPAGRIRVGTSESASDIINVLPGADSVTDLLFEATGEVTYIGLAPNSTAVGFSKGFRNISVRKTPAAGTYNNFQADLSDREDFLLGADGIWEGRELWNNTPTVGTQWTDNGGGSYSLVGDGSSNTIEAAVLVVGDTFRTSLVCTAITGGDDMKIGYGFAATTFNTQGPVSVTAVATSTALAFLRAAAVDIVSATIRDISAKRVLQVATQNEGFISQYPLALTRRYQQLDGTDDSFAIPAAVAASDFVVQGSFTSSSTNASMRILSTSDNTNDGIQLYLDGTANVIKMKSIIATVASYTTMSDVLTSGVIHGFSFERVGDAFTVTVNGVTGASKTAAVTLVDFVNIGVLSNGSYFTGIIYNVNFKSGFVSSDGAINPYYALDDADHIARNRNVTVGPELSTSDSDYTVVEGLSTVTNRVIHILTTIDGESTVVRFNPTEAGKTYILSCDVEVVGGAVTITVGPSGTSAQTYVPDTGSIELAIDPGEWVVFKRGNGSQVNDATVSNISIREAPGYGIANNMEADFSDKETYTLRDDGSLIGVATRSLTNNIQTLEDLQINSGITVSGSRITRTSTTGNYFGNLLNNTAGDLREITLKVVATAGTATHLAIRFQDTYPDRTDMTVNLVTGVISDGPEIKGAMDVKVIKATSVLIGNSTHIEFVIEEAQAPTFYFSPTDIPTNDIDGSGAAAGLYLDLGFPDITYKKIIEAP